MASQFIQLDASDSSYGYTYKIASIKVMESTCQMYLHKYMHINLQYIWYRFWRYHYLFHVRWGVAFRDQVCIDYIHLFLVVYIEVLWVFSHPVIQMLVDTIPKDLWSPSPVQPQHTSRTLISVFSLVMLVQMSLCPHLTTERKNNGCFPIFSLVTKSVSEGDRDPSRFREPSKIKSFPYMIY